MKFAIIAGVVALAGCAEHRIAVAEFRDYLTFNEICREEQNHKEEYCSEQWREYTEAKAKTAQAGHTTYSISNVQVGSTVNADLWLYDGDHEQVLSSELDRLGRGE